MDNRSLTRARTSRCSIQTPNFLLFFVQYKLLIVYHSFHVNITTTYIHNFFEDV